MNNNYLYKINAHIATHTQNLYYHNYTLSRMVTKTLVISSKQTTIVYMYVMYACTSMLSIGSCHSYSISKFLFSLVALLTDPSV